MRLTSIISGFMAMLALCFLLYFQSKTNLVREQQLEEQMITMIEAVNNLAATKLQISLENSTAALQGFAVLEENKESMVASEVSETIGRMATVYGFEQTFLCDLDGNAYSSQGKRRNVSDTDYYKDALSGTSGVSYQSLLKEDEKTVIFGVPITFLGETTAVLIASWSKDKLDTLLSSSAFRGKEEVYLINSKGGILYSLSGNSIEGDSLWSLWKEKDSIYYNTEQIIKQGRYFTEKVLSKDGSEYCISYKGIRGFRDWGVTTVIKKEDFMSFMSVTSPSGNYFLYAGLAGILALFTLSIYQSRKRYNLQRLAYMDHITKSYNFKGFMERVNTMFEKDQNTKHALLQLTLEKFDYFKELFGDNVTNETLYHMANTIARYLHSDEAYCRYNTLNFLVMLKYQSEQELKERLQYLKEKIEKLDGSESLNKKFDYNIEMGIYCINQKDIGIDMMINRANTALQAALNNRYSPFEFYDASIENSVTEDREYEEHMYEALREKEFLIYFQPKFSLKTGRQMGAEALVRWMHPEKGLLYPGSFISLFEKNGFIVELDMYILEEICGFLKRCIRKGIRPMPLSLNISMQNLYRENFAERVIDIVDNYGVPANLICLEFAEETIVKNIALVQEILEKLKREGFLISMDDFGDGTTSMNTLYQVPVDELKIDRKFLIKTENSDRGRTIIGSIIEISRKLDIQVVAEGVENKQQAQMLRDSGCDMMQGFVFCEPLPLREYQEYAHGARAGENYIKL